MRRRSAEQKQMTAVMRGLKKATFVSCMVATLALLVGGDGAAAQGGAAAPYVPKDLLTTEVRDLNTLVQALETFLKRADPLDKKAQVSKAEIDVLVVDAEAVKRAIPTFQRGVASLISKLQAGGKWTPEFDASIESRLNQPGVDSSVLRGVRQQGGARTVLQSAAAAATDVGRAVDRNVTELRGKTLIGRLLQELIGTPVHASFSLVERGRACLIFKAAQIGCAAGFTLDCHDAVFFGAICRGLN